MRGVLTGAGTALRIAAVAAVLAAASAAPATAAPDYAPVDRPGPALSVPEPRLDASLRCSGPLGGGSTPVLLVPGTTVTPDKNFSWNWVPALNKIGRPWCTVELPGSSMEDIQIAGEHVVHAIRTMSAEFGGRIDVLGHSQGGMVPRWALRFWPDTRELVDDLVGLAPSNHGTETARPPCRLPGGCAPAIWQQRRNSAFIGALNSRQETFAGVDYTVIYTITDVIVFPNLNDKGSSSLRGGDGAVTNVAIQDVCPLDVSEHLAVGTISNTGYALAVDALENPGPAAPARVRDRVCLSPLMPGLDPATFALDFVDAGAHLALTFASYRHDPAEPPLACYVTASCPASGGAAAAPAARVAAPEHRAKKRKRSKRR